MSNIGLQLLDYFFILILNLNRIKNNEGWLFLLTTVFNFLLTNFRLHSFTDWFSFILVYHTTANWLAEWDICAKSSELYFTKVTLISNTRFSNSWKSFVIALLYENRWLLKTIRIKSSLNLKLHHDLYTWTYIFYKVYRMQVLILQILFFFA